MAEVPSDLAQWFRTGTTLAERFNLPRIEFRFRVVEVEHVLGDAENPYIIKGESKEYKTKVGADQLARRWAREGRNVIQQTAVMVWLTEEEMPGPFVREPTPSLK